MGSRSDVIDATLAGTRIRRKRIEETLVIPGNIAANFQLSAEMPPVIMLGASAARTIRMPTGSEAINGLCLTLMSNSTTTTGVLTLNTSTGAALSPAVTITQALSAELIYIHGVGWRKKAQ